jgi:hypothetical protein
MKQQHQKTPNLTFSAWGKRKAPEFSEALRQFIEIVLVGVIA